MPAPIPPSPKPVESPEAMPVTEDTTKIRARRLDLLAQLQAARRSRRAANEALINCAQSALSNTPHAGYPMGQMAGQGDKDDPSESGVRKLPPTERMTQRLDQLAHAREARRAGAEALKRTAMGVSCYTDSKEFALTDELRAELKQAKEEGPQNGS